MSHGLSLGIIWSSAFVGGVAVLGYIVISHEMAIQRGARPKVAVMVLLLIGVVQLPPIHHGLRWGLSLLAFTAPVAGGVIAIRELVETPS